MCNYQQLIGISRLNGLYIDHEDCKKKEMVTNSYHTFHCDFTFFSITDVILIGHFIVFVLAKKKIYRYYHNSYIMYTVLTILVLQDSLLLSRKKLHHHKMMSSYKHY